MGRGAVGARRARRRAGLDRPLRPDARPRRSRRRRARAPAGDPLERPAHRGRVRGDRAALGLERLIELTGNRALTGFTAPKLLWLRTHEPETFERIRHVLLPKDYVRFRMTGEHAIDVADASGTLLFDVGNRRWSEEVLPRSSSRAEWLPPAHECTEIAGAGDQAAGALGVGVDRPGRALGRARHLRRRLRGPARVPPRARGAAPYLLPRRPGHLARDGRDAVGGRLAAVAARRSRRRALRGAARRGGAARSPASRASSSSPTSRASGRRMPTRTPAARSSASRSDTTAARSSRDSRGRRVRPARLARAAALARRRGRARPRLGRRRRAASSG